MMNLVWCDQCAVGVLTLPPEQPLQQFTDELGQGTPAISHEVGGLGGGVGARVSGPDTTGEDVVGGPFGRHFRLDLLPPEHNPEQQSTLSTQLSSMSANGHSTVGVEDGELVGELVGLEVGASVLEDGWALDLAVGIALMVGMLLGDGEGSRLGCTTT